MSLAIPTVGVAAKDLLQVAESWRAAARESALAAGHEDRPRPRFANPPALLKAPIGFRKYRRRLAWWASRYAWDRADGLPVEESAKGLIHTAMASAAE